MTPVGQTADFALKRTGGIQQSFKFKTRHHVRMFSVAVFFKHAFRHLAKTGRHDDGADINFTFHRLLGKINGVAATDRHADLAGIMLYVQAGLWINEIGGRHGLGIIDMNGPGNGQTFIIIINQMTGTVGGAKTAGRTLVSIYVTGI